jgi:TolB-like protein
MPAKAATSQPAAAGVAIAVLDFEANSPGNPEMGKQIAELLSASLSGFRDCVMVDRADLTRTLQEQQMSLSGMVNTMQAVKFGKLVGARILITGKAFSMGQQMFVTARLIGTETRVVKGVLVEAKLDTDIAELAGLLSEKVAQQLVEAGPRLIARQAARLGSSDANAGGPGLEVRRVEPTRPGPPGAGNPRGPAARRPPTAPGPAEGSAH